MRCLSSKKPAKKRDNKMPQLLTRTHARDITEADGGCMLLTAAL